MFAHIERDERLRALAQVIGAEREIKEAMIALGLWPEGQCDCWEDTEAKKYFDSILHLIEGAISDLAGAESRVTH